MQSLYEQFHKNTPWLIFYLYITCTEYTIKVLHATMPYHIQINCVVYENIQVFQPISVNSAVNTQKNVSDATDRKFFQTACFWTSAVFPSALICIGQLPEHRHQCVSIPIFCTIVSINSEATTYVCLNQTINSRGWQKAKSNITLLITHIHFYL